jgi:LysM repeat protein
MCVRRLLCSLVVLAAALALTVPAQAWSGCGQTYVVQWGDTLASVAYKCGTSMAAIRQANPGLGYWLYAGTTISMPGYGPVNAPAHRTYVVQWGDTLRGIAGRMNVSVSDILAVNPQIWNANWIFWGQVINLPTPAQYYTIHAGDTLRGIAARFGTTVAALQNLNSQIWNPDVIYVGQVIRIW